MTSCPTKLSAVEQPSGLPHGPALPGVLGSGSADRIRRSPRDCDVIGLGVTCCIESRCPAANQRVGPWPNLGLRTLGVCLRWSQRGSRRALVLGPGELDSGTPISLDGLKPHRRTAGHIAIGIALGIPHLLTGFAGGRSASSRPQGPDDAGIRSPCRSAHRFSPTW